MPGLDILSGSDADDALARYLNGDWWIIPRLTDDSARLMELVENSVYYEGAAAEDFHILMGPIGIFGPACMACAFAHKRRMSPEQFTSLIDEHLSAATRARVLEGLHDGQDILVPFTRAE